MNTTKNFLDIVENAKIILETSLYSSLSRLLEFRAEIEATMCLFEHDKDSLKNYADEILFKLLIPFSNLDTINKYSTKIMPKEFQKNMSIIDIEDEYRTAGDDIATRKRCKLRVFDMNHYAFKKVCISSGDCVYDAGSCYGDVTIWALKNGAAHVVAFEPEENNFKTLLKTIDIHKIASKVTPVFSGLGKKEETLYFHHGTIPGAGYASDSKSDFPIQVTTIDKCSEDTGKKPTFIKMDIEGAELSALQGGGGVLESYPRLAISLYHKLHDMWEIPLWLHKNYPKYKFYARKVDPRVEFVLYAIKDGI